MKGASVVLASQSLLVACERVIVDVNGDDMVQLQSRSVKMGTKDLDSFLDTVQTSKVEPAELLSNEIAVAQLAEAVESSHQKLDDKTKHRLHQFKTFVMETEQDIKDAHKADQASLDAGHGAGYSACMKKFHTATEENAEVKASWTAKETKHMACRKLQKELADKMQSACGDLVTYQKLLKGSDYAVPTTSDWLEKPTSECLVVKAPDTNTFGTWFDKMVASKKSWDLRSEACATAATALEKKKDECEDEQQGFESDFCAWRNAAYHNCYDQQICQVGKLGNFASDKEGALKRAEVRKVHWQSAKHVMCFLDVMLHTNSSVASCKKDIDAGFLDLIIPDKKMELEECKLPGLGSFPGSGGWGKRYEDAKCDAVKSKKCESIPKHVLKVTTKSEEQSFVRWGHKKCPDGAELLFSGYVGSSHDGHKGGGSNALCLHTKPTYPEGYSTGNHNGGNIYGTEYENTGGSDKNHDKDVVCAMCIIRGATFTQWGRNKCPEGHRTEYKGLIMATHYGHQKGQYVCVDEEREYRDNSQANHNGNRWYTTEFETGSLPSSVFKANYEASCAQCTMEDHVSSYVRWGKRDCGDAGTKVFTGYMAGEMYTHHGGSAMTICLHPDPIYAPGHSSGNNNGALIYGAEYEYAGSGNKVHNHEPVCTMCAVHGHSHTQWGRSASCPENYILEYKGFVMADHHGHHKSSWLCIDEAREYTLKSSTSNHNGLLLYTSEYEQGSLPNNIFKHGHEISCAQCTADDGTNSYVRWGAKKCADHATTLYMGYAAGAHNSHRGGGYETLCLHPQPTDPTVAKYSGGGKQNWGRLYGTEYQNTGAIDKNHDKDAVCAMCAVTGQTFVQWGRDVCPEDHRTEYKGVIMADHYNHYASEYVCVDREAAYMTNGQEGNHDGNLWYTVEFQTGALPSSNFKNDAEASCAVCSTTPM